MAVCSVISRLLGLICVGMALLFAPTVRVMSGSEPLPVVRSLRRAVRGDGPRLSSVIEKVGIHPLR